MNRLMIVSTSLIVLTLVVGVSHATTDEYSEQLETLERLIGDGKKITKMYSGKKQSEAELSQILVLPGLSITAVDGDRVKSKKGGYGYSAYKQLPGTYKFEVTSWKRDRRLHYVGLYGNDKHAAYALQVVLEAGQKYVLSPIWNDGELGIIAPSQVCLQGQSDSARYCALRPRESDDVFAMDEKYGVIVVGLTQSIVTNIIVRSLDCEWRGTGFSESLKNSRATKLRDVCQFIIDPEDSKGYIVESVDAGVWKWWGLVKGHLIETITFDVEPGKVNYVGHVAAAYDEVTDDFSLLESKGFGRKPLGFRVTDDFSLLEPILRAGFGDSEIVNKAIHY